MGKVIRRLSFVCFYFVSFALLADAPWPLPDGVRPIAPASTWQDNGNVKIDFSGKGRIRGAINGTEIGYKNGSELAGNHGNACDDGECEANQQLRLPVNKNQIAFDAPNGAIPINLSGNTTISQSGIYEATSNDVQISSLTIETGASVLLYANKLKVDGGRINVESGDASDFVLVVTGDTEFINAGTVDGHILSEQYLMLKNTNLTGTLITDELKIDEGGLLGGELPDPPDFQTCEFRGNDDFIVEMTVTGSDTYKELYLTRQNNTQQRYQTLWYNQDPPPSPPANYPEEFLFLETGLQDGVTYNIRIEYIDGSGNALGTAFYYLKEQSETEYVLQQQLDVNIQSGQLAGQGDGIEQLDCENEPVTPPPANNRQLELSPKQAINLTCDLPELLDFQVVDSSGNPDGTFTGDLIVNFSGSTTYTTNVVTGSSSGANRYKTNGAGLLQIELSDRSVGEVSVDAYIDGSQDSTLQQGNYEYVPNKFQFSPTPVLAVANRIEATTIQAMQCDSNGDPEAIPADKYSGTKNLSLTATSYLQPQTDVRNRVNVELRQTGTTSWTQVDNNSINVTFSSAASANLDLRYTEAGSVSFEASDQICITDDAGNQLCETIKGLQQVDSIPWTFAICHADKSLNGTAYTGDAFIAAGRTFALELRPLQYQESSTVSPSQGIDVTNMCNDAITQNFFGSDAPNGSAIVDAQLATPEASRGGSLGLGLQGDKSITNSGKNALNLSNLMWDEVGSLSVNVSGTYLQRNISTGFRNVGRFYPDHLILSDDHFDAPTGQDQFTYMGQPVAAHGFVVEARNALAESDATDNVTNNYGLFDSSLVVTIDYDAFDDQGTDLTPRLSVTPTDLQWQGDAWGSGGNYGQLVIDFTDYQLDRELVTGAANLTTQADGPYDTSNSTFGLRVSDVVDDVNWQGASDADEIEVFNDDYDFRYGRMVLSDVAGNSNSIITVPLRVEHWDGSGFVRNSDDGIDLGAGILGSRYDGQYFCSQAVWQDGGSSDAQLDGQGGVMEGLPMDGTAANGEDSEPLFAHQGNNSGERREQMRMWLHIGASSPLKQNSGDPAIDCSSNYTDRPWLRYNWRNLGDEDPSAVITFGTFRGNDRVIYRGETGLTGN